MWDMVWSSAREHLAPLLIEAANMIRGIPKEISEIKDELERVQTSINIADRMAEVEEDNTPDGIKRKVKLLIEAAFHIEDVIDEYEMCEAKQPRDPGCAALPCEPNDFLKTMILRLQIAYKIKDIQSQVCAIQERSGREGSQTQPSSQQGPDNSGGNQDVTLEHLRRSALYIEEAEVVGFEAPRDQLIGWLVQGRIKRTVITLEGMGGQGKTTLAKKVSENNKVIGHFDCHAWVTVSQTYTRDGLLRDMLEKFYKEEKVDPPPYISTMQGEPLMNEVRDYLREKRHVVFFDDVWNELFWDDIGLAFIDKENGSRVFITTRKTSVTSCCKKNSSVEVHKLEPLTPDQSLDLFYKKAFQFDLDGRCPPDLVKISSKIVDKCGGLPLAIVAIGGLLSGKDRDPLEWELFSQHLSSELEKNPQLSAITKILGFSYHDLPNYLKPCLLYFGMYPEDFEIKSKRLIRQWVAEGFVKHERGKTLEVVASQYLTELINRSLVQVSLFSVDGKARSCRVHDLSHEMILRKIEDLSFCHYISDDDNQSILSGIVRRLSIITSSNDFLGPMETSHIRSLLCFTKELPENFLYTILTKYTLVKVLDIDGAYLAIQVFKTVSKNWGNLIHLKYLSFKVRAELVDLPSLICELQNLETLDLKYINIVKMPKEIRKLRKLRHLMASCIYLIQMKDCIGGMTFLQTLRYVDLDHYEEEIVLLKTLRE